jgi:2-dehydro-3-deoxy-D-arabinonate dehydratase
MKLANIVINEEEIRTASIEGDQAFLFEEMVDLSMILHSEDPLAVAKEAREASTESVPISEVEFLAPIEDQEVWAAGVTYQRSKVAREEESAGAAQFYDKVYTADRPELFLKSTSQRVVDPLQPVHIRSDSKWNVPEPELALVINPEGKIVGYTIGNDMSSRDIEGENPLYLPQAKIYKRSCSLGPVVTLVSAFPAIETVQIKLEIERDGQVAYTGETGLNKMARSLESLAEWLFKENEFPGGAFLLTGTGIVPPDSFTLAVGDVVKISIDGIGTLINPVD